MLKSSDGNYYNLSHPNPLMKNQSTSNIGRGTYIDWELFGESETEVVKHRLDHIESAFHAIGTEDAILPGTDAPKPKPKQRTHLKQIVDDLYGDVMPAPKGYQEDEEVLRNKDGTPYSPSGKMDMYDPNNPEHDLMDDVDQESIQLSGADIEYYRVMIDGRMDDLYLEQSEKVFISKPFVLKAVYDPVTPQIQFGGMGPGIFDSIESMTFYFNRKTFIETVGELPKVGSLIKTCDEGVWWEVMENQINFSDGERKIWGKHRIGVACKKYRPVITDRSPSGQGRETFESGKASPVRIR